jgi:photosystem II stability/assembly factor-like uncharacterized protein
MTDTLLMVGTRKGLWIGQSDDAREEWSWTGPHFDMMEIYSAMIDRRRGRVLAGASSPWTGPQLCASTDLGASWNEIGPVAFPESSEASVERIWQLVPGPDEGVLYAGTEPGAVFRSTDDGKSFHLVEGLWNHPHRKEWGAGFGGQAFHTILPHPTDPDSITAALSAGGVYQTSDGGKSWDARNVGVQAEFLPEGQQYPEFGQCVHKIARHPSRPETLFMQNHGGVYRSDDHAASWQSIEKGLPSNFGFAMVVHPHQPETIYNFPLGGSGGRYPVDARARVWRSRDGGGTWEALGGDGHGLPDNFYVAVMRDAMCVDDHDTVGVYFGARNGSVFASNDEGDTWHEVASGLPDVMCVRAGVL